MLSLCCLLGLTLWLPANAHAFCGFYVAAADTDLFNRASKVVMVRDGDRTVLTMASDFRGEPQQFALVIPVPTALEREQINVTERGVLEHLDNYTAPRLVEYHDPNPCQVARYKLRRQEAPAVLESAVADVGASRSLGVRVEAQYTVGEYDVLILSAEESSGLQTWLRQEGYRLPEGAEPVLASYIRQGLRFFVAKVNLQEQARLGYSYLRPLQVAYETPRFMLPIRLGTVNADGPQELFVFALTRTGRVETTNYRTQKIPSDEELPLFVRDEFGEVYQDLFTRQVERERMRTVFLEYAWDMNWCDPCAADPLSFKELRQLGVFWVPDWERPSRGGQRRPEPPGARDVFVTRLHLRYTAESFPEDLRFQETGDRSNFQARYILRNPWLGKNDCPAAQDYRRKLEQREERQATTLAHLTGDDVQAIRQRMGLDRIDQGTDSEAKDERPWWQRLWGTKDG